ncbi:MAG: M4 family metallopeptidase [Patescibacteria group bacterium]
MSKVWYGGCLAFIAVFFALINPGIVQAMTAASVDGFQIITDIKTKSASAITSGPEKILPLKTKPTAADPAEIAGQAMKEYGGFFGLKQPDQELQLLAVNSDSLSMKHVRYNQSSNGVPVFGAQTIVHLTKDSDIASINGNTIPDVSIITTPLISQEMAIALSKNHWNQQGLPMAPTVTNASLVVFNKGLIENTIGQVNHLAWRVELYNQFPQAKESYFIDAYDGGWLYQITGIQTAISRRIYDCGVDSVLCYLDFSYLGHVFGRSEGQPSHGANILVGGTDVDDLYSYSGSIHTYYSITFGLDGGNDLGGIGDGTHNAVTKTDGWVYIDYVGGACPNAYFDGYSINFCQDYEVLDVVGHEYNHAVATFAIPPDGFTYSYESGALSEAYADIFGEAAQNYVEGSSDWQMGEDLPGGAMRSLSDPAGGGYPDRFYSPNVYCGSSDNGGIHTNNTILGHAAYLIATGGTFNGCTISGIGRTKEEAIFYRALTVYSTASSDFNDTYTALINACNDLYGTGSSDCTQVMNALQSVEFDQSGLCSAVPAVTPACVVPTIASISSDKTNGYYKTGSIIDIDVTLSNTVTGSLSLTLNTGASCSISFSNSATGSCDYTIADGQNISDLDVTSISGTVTNTNGVAMANFTPTASLASLKNITVDTTLPTGTVTINGGNSHTNSGTATLTLSASDTNGVPYMNFYNGSAWSGWETYATSRTWSLDTASQGAKTVYVQFADAAGNIMSASASDEIIYDSTVPQTSASPSGGWIVNGRQVTLTANETSTIYYTTDGTAPATSSTVYDSPVTINADMTIGYFAVDDAGNTEDYKTTTFTVIRSSYILAAAGPGSSPLIKAISYAGKVRSTPRNLYPFSQSYLGGVHLAACDVDYDYKDEIVVGVGTGEEPWVKVYRQNGTLVTQFLAYAKTIKGGVFVACGDLNGDHLAEIVTGVPEGYGPHVRVFSGLTGKAKLTNGFFAYEKQVRTGIRVAAGDLDGDGTDEIIVGTGRGAGAHVRTFSGTGALKFTPGFFVYEKTDRSGVNVAAGDVNADGVDEIITGSGVGRVGEIKIYSRAGTLLKKITPYGTGYKLGVKVAAGDLDADGTSEIVAATEKGGAPQVRAFRFNGSVLGTFFAYDSKLRNGVDMAVGSLD